MESNKKFKTAWKHFVLEFGKTNEQELRVGICATLVPEMIHLKVHKTNTSIILKRKHTLCCFHRLACAPLFYCQSAQLEKNTQMRLRWCPNQNYVKTKCCNTRGMHFWARTSMINVKSALSLLLIWPRNKNPGKYQKPAGARYQGLHANSALMRSHESCHTDWISEHRI